MQICMNVVIGRYISDAVRINDVSLSKLDKQVYRLDRVYRSVISIVHEIVLISKTSLAPEVWCMDGRWHHNR